MKLHKLVKSIDYATYPLLYELRKINDTLGNSLSTLRDMIIAAIIGLFLDITPISKLIVAVMQKSKWACLICFGNYENANKIIAVFLALLAYGVLCLYHFIKKRWGSNKNTINARKDITFEFFKVVLPNLILVKSLIKQACDSKCDEDKKILLLFQAKHEIGELIALLSKLDILEIDKKTKSPTRDSLDILGQIGQDAYFTVLIDIINRAKEIYDKLKECESKQIHNTLVSLKSTFNSAHVFLVHEELNFEHPLNCELKMQYKKAKAEMNSTEEAKHIKDNCKEL